MVDLNEFYELYDEAETGRSENGIIRCFINKKTGELLQWFDPGYFGDDADEADEIMQRVDEEDDWLEFPDKYDLRIRRPLPLDFAEDELEEADYRLISGFFSRRGAYGNFRDYIDRIGVTEIWYRYEDKAIKDALKKWLELYNIEYTE